MLAWVFPGIFGRGLTDLRDGLRLLATSLPSSATTVESTSEDDELRRLWRSSVVAGSGDVVIGVGDVATGVEDVASSAGDVAASAGDVGCVAIVGGVCGEECVKARSFGCGFLGSNSLKRASLWLMKSCNNSFA